MAAELNIPRHTYYQRRYNVRLPRRAESRKWIDVTGAAVPASLLRFSEPYPWTPMTSLEVNEWVDEQDLDVPGNWFTLSLAAKKAYLQAHYGTP